MSLLDDMRAALDDCRTKAASLLGSNVYVDCYAALVADELHIEVTVGLKHHDGYKLQVLGTGETFDEALVMAVKTQESIHTLRPRKDASGQEMQRRNIMRRPGSSVLGELEKLKNGL